jgi:exopolysaccharide biosynthesis polyprenyl glycosylphosphotransferase
MTREQLQFRRRLFVVADLLVTGASFVAVFFVRDWVRTHYTLDLLPHLRVLADVGLHPLAAHLALVPHVALIWSASLAWAGTYSAISSRQELLGTRSLLRGSLAATVATVAMLYLLKVPYMGRSYLLPFCLANAGALLAYRRALLLLCPDLVRGTDMGTRALLVVGTGPRARAFVSRVAGTGPERTRVVGLLDRDERRVGSLIDGIPVLGTIDRLGEILHSHVVDEVVLVVPRRWLASLQETIWQCEVEGIRVSFLTDLFTPQLGRVVCTELEGWPALTIMTVRQSEGERFAKRAVDFIGGCVALCLTAPLMAGIALAVRLSSPGPILFRQERVGLNGRRFTLYKFRTMVADAERRQAQLLKLNEMDGPVFKITRDPRVTRVGAILRNCSLDELPQLFNVIRSEMSLVGPRPPIPSEVLHYEPWQRRRLSVKPGITCLWQVSGRNRIGFKRWMTMDLEYIDNWSLWLDLKLLWRTIPAVMKREGAS